MSESVSRLAGNDQFQRYFQPIQTGQFNAAQNSNVEPAIHIDQ
ncbi:hypothetical protein [Pedobacter hiemivivus]|nr:hypothetical protein [Pedobacter hiemivivus]